MMATVNIKQKQVILQLVEIRTLTTQNNNEW
jgi:hypothetical protein